MKTPASRSTARSYVVPSTRVILTLASLALTPSAISANAQVANANRASVYPDNQTYIQPQDKIAAEKVINSDEWDDANNPRRMLARIQSNLDRVSAGRPTWPVPSGETGSPLLKIVDAYADFLHGDFKDMDAALASLEPLAETHQPTYPGDRTYKWVKENPAFYTSYAAAIHSNLPLVRLYAGIRVVDGALFGSFGNPFDGTGPANIHTASTSPLDGTWLKLPCRTIIGRVQQFVAAAAPLKSLGGPVLDCPVEELADYAKDEMLALKPEHLSPHVTPPQATNKEIEPSNTTEPPLQPGSQAAAIYEMGTQPQEAAPVLEHYSRVDGRGKLDYALFLHAFEPQTSARDATIRKLQAELQKEAMASPGAVHDFPPTPYDGTDASLLNIIRLASETGVAGIGYDIPCPILIARPALLAATQPYYFSNRDNFMPRSGCGNVIAGFPSKAVDAFEAASTEADGNFIEAFQGSMVYGFEAQRNATNEQMRLNPHYFLDLNPQTFGYPDFSFQYPYQVWGYTSLNNYVVSQRLRKLFSAAVDKVAAYYQKQTSLDREDSREAARTALFLATFGGNCGGGVPATSLRRMLLEHASRRAIEQQLKWGVTDAPEIDACAKFAGKDPLLLVAIGDPAAFPTILQHNADVNVRNPIGKTALMEAAQFNQLEIVDSLLAHHASVNATTWGDSDPLNGKNSQLGDDARTALMYAAANGSLKLIKRLLDAGADPFQADTKGYRAIDYLLGYGPTPPNPHLSTGQREQATRLLF